MNPVKVSVIMGVYNDEKFVTDAIQSILNQTYTNFEFIICDDCSKDSSPNVIETFAQKDPRIVILHNSTNQGLATSLNNCIAVANGEYIARMDSDDVALPIRLQEEVSFLDSHPEYAVVGAQVEYINNNSEPYRTSNFATDISTTDVIHRVSVVHPTTMIRKSVIDEVHGYTVNKMTRRAEDYDLWCKIVEKGYALHNLDKILLKYREDTVSFKKRKYEYRIDEFNIKNYWRKRMHYSIIHFPYAFKPLIIGLIPKFIIFKMRKIKQEG